MNKNPDSISPISPGAATRSLVDRKQIVKKVIEEALAANQCALVAVPTFQPDGRGGFYVACTISIRGNEER